MKNNFIKYIPTVSKLSLLYIAGAVWATAGLILLWRALQWEHENFLFVLSICLAAGSLFYFIIFRNIVASHTERIVQLKNKRPFIFSFFNLRSYLLMFFMISMGVTLRKSDWIPEEYLSWMFFIMSVPLLISGTQFFIIATRYSTKNEL